MGIEFNLKDLLEVFEKLKPYLTLLWIVDILMLILPIKIMDFLGLVAFRNTFRPWMGFFALAGFVEAIRSWHESKKDKSAIAEEKQNYQDSVIAKLSSLTREEVFIVQVCLFNMEQTIILKVIDPTTVSLCSKGIIEAAGGTGNADAYPYHIPDFVWKYLRQKKRLYLPENLENNHYFQEQIHAFEHRRRLRKYE